MVVDANDGSVLQIMEFDSFGQVLSDSNPGFQPFGFAGGLYDPDTGLVRFGVRDYSPEIGRWTAKDPELFSDGLNLYTYTGNDPVNSIDPTGKIGVPVAFVTAGFGAAIGGVFGGVASFADSCTSLLSGFLGGAATGALVGFLGGAGASGGTIVTLKNIGQPIGQGLGAIVGSLTGLAISGFTGLSTVAQGMDGCGEC